ncbi:YceI family protein [Arenimonas sp.]|uniref:YceI family protein n=1 Tax=Arenimonas sp. TaxID=1872635 RepID=UPI0039E588A7
MPGYRLPAFFLASALLPLCAEAKLEQYRLDPVHTRVAFQVSHAGFSNPVGSFSGVQGELRFDPDDWASSRVEVRIPLATLSLGDADWQKRILDPTFFDAERYPTATFRSLRVEKIDDTHGRLHGELTLHGKTQPVSLDFVFNALKRHPLTFRRTAGFSASGTLRRGDFGIDAWKNLVGDEVKLIIEAEAIRGGPDSNDKDGEEMRDASTQ